MTEYRRRLDNGDYTAKKETKRKTETTTTETVEQQDEAAKPVTKKPATK